MMSYYRGRPAGKHRVGTYLSGICGAKISLNRVVSTILRHAMMIAARLRHLSTLDDFIFGEIMLETRA